VADVTPPATEDPSLRTSVLRNLGGAVGLVVLMAAVFGALGMIGREDTPTPIAAEAPDDAADVADAGDEGEADEPAEDPDGSAAETEDAASDEDEAAEESDPEPADEPADAAADAADGDEAEGEAEDAAADDEGTEDEPDEPAAPAIPPGDISIQVLDGYKTDGGTAARGVASTLRDRGYRVVAENQALSYDRTAVLWTEGHEAAARQVAAEIGAAEVREQPGNLSSSVSVHVVVGADRA
jgi:hypothetical protein